jgi:hypothetical protein
LYPAKQGYNPAFAILAPAGKYVKFCKVFGVKKSNFLGGTETVP